MVKLSLPTQKTPIITDLNKMLILLYGEHKVGKSKMTSEIEDNLILDCEAGYNSLNAATCDVNNVQEFQEYVKLFLEGNHSYNKLSIDPIDRVVEMYLESECKRFGMEHESDAKFGKIYKNVAKIMRRIIITLGNSPYGLFLVGHSLPQENKKTRTGEFRMNLNCSPSIQGAILDSCDIILYAEPITHKGEDIRVMHSRATDRYIAGDRTNRLPPTMKFGWKHFKDAWEKGTPESKEKKPAKKVSLPVSKTKQGETK